MKGWTVYRWKKRSVSNREENGMTVALHVWGQKQTFASKSVQHNANVAREHITALKVIPAVLWAALARNWVFVLRLKSFRK